ncbi:hypothetical protein CBM2589_U10164 [Cupriavidus taiwanensis]|uniref:Uncharacterized protein n=1 Tax=Cupriavidus taiwanensis TaxID=164546 RepID=A0A375CQH1_9BURK|nr:hypothetical protein CBM2589_U10164 [Cupriavidus taiwanensis]
MTPSGNAVATPAMRFPLSDGDGYRGRPRRDRLAASPSRRISTAAALSILLSACADSPMRIAASDPAALQAKSADKLCVAYGKNFGREKVRAELQRRDALTPREWEHVDKRKVFIGMSSTAALCSWGSPDRINSTIRAAPGRNNGCTRAPRPPIGGATACTPWMAAWRPSSSNGRAIRGTSRVETGGPALQPS